MPQDWVEPDVAFVHRGIKVYHVYRNDHYQDMPRETQFSLDITGGEGDGKAEGVVHTDDLSEIPDELAEKYAKYPAEEAKVRHAIDSGYFDDWDLEELQPEGWEPRKQLPRPEMLETFWKHIDPSPDGYSQKIEDLLTYLTDEQLDAVLENMHVFDEEEQDAQSPD